VQNLANRITFARIVLTPIFFILLMSDFQYRQWFAASAFALIALSDGLDGYFARAYNQVTNLGKNLDPLADKLVVIAALVALVQVASLPVWVAALIIGREIAVSILRLMANRKNIAISASSLGKAKTFFQVIAIFFWIFNVDGSLAIINQISWILIVVAVILSFVSAFNYFAKFREIWT